ncbi:rhodanese-related sulfurtransferase [Brevibacillus borstelensis]|uniref:oxygen-dependent tRNA uridine(34) hydroxylase TrhO n=1 Tax=Brevibacillus borstelensis TaxID=45462 RepID=UPI0030BD68AF
MQVQKPYRILLYYKYVHLDNYEEYAAEHLAFCKELGLKGRIIVAPEGLNGTVSGTVEQTDAYMEFVRKDPRFADIWFKIDEADGHAFKKMFVRPKKELVTWRLEDDFHPTELTGKYLSPKEFYEMLQRQDVVVLDGRNDYEYELGHFRGAIRPGVESSREFPEWIRENISQFKDKKVLTYCTGGIRCEKLTGVLLKEGFEEVYQLHGGIVTYGKDPEVRGRLWDGKCYVFDERISVKINHTEEDVVISTCYYCGKPEDRYVNCANPFCNKQHFCCTECERKYKRSCSDECREHPRNRYVEEENNLQPAGQ